MPPAHDTLAAISRAGFTLLLKEPFYAHLLAGMPREVSERVETAAVGWDGSQVQLIVNPGFFSTLASDDERVAVLKHELLHVVFRHLFRGTGRNQELENIAADLVVNQLVAPWPLPANVVTLDCFPDLKLEPNRSLEYYYDRLAGLRRPPSGASAAAPGDDTSTPSEAEMAPNSAAMLDSLLAQGGRGDHSLWKLDASPAAAAASFAVEEAVLRASARLGAGGMGTLPAALREALGTIASQRRPTVDWKRALRLFCSGTGSTRVRHTMRKPSRRYGTTPGIRIQRLRRLLVAVDTSGSIADSTLQLFFSEIHGMWRTGAAITVVECDAAVHAVYPYRGVPPQAVTGRGGTSFDPVFTWMRERRAFDGCVYLTDGAANDPVVKPPCPILWAQCCSRHKPLPYGRTVVISA